MTELTSRLTFGYHLRGTGSGDLLGPQIVDLRDFLKRMENTPQIGVAAWFSTHHYSASSSPALRIRLEGPLDSLEQVLNQVIEHEGVPTFVDKPRSKGKMGWPYLDPWLARFNLAPDTPTTPDAYKMAQGMYKQIGARVMSLDDNTLGIAQQLG